MNVVIEDMKQRVADIAEKLGRYLGRIDRLRQNRMFQNNKRQFYRELNQGRERYENQKSYDTEVLKWFWGSIWD